MVEVGQRSFASEMTAEMEKCPPATSSRRAYLRRSRTITCNVYPPTRPIQDHGTEDKVREASPTDTKASPKSSCQALRHAVSALTRLDDFICEKIGAGFFSEVFKVTHRITGQVMALKMNTMTSNRSNMLREVQLLNRLSHPNILRFMGVCVHEGQLHALTEFIEGGSLEQVLSNEDEELPWIQRIHLTLGVARGLDYLHSRGAMHRDLTSKNILIRREDNRGYHAVVADFGLATKIPDPLSKEKLPTVGSPYWMAPEVLVGDFYNERADLFSLGIMMCEITARISADPDIMPRMNNFGVDYVALSEMIAYCPLDYLQLAFKCCQVDPIKRPVAYEIIEWLEKIFRNLQNDIFTRQEKEKSELNGYKRSRSEDNILQANDSEADTSNEDIIITPQLIGQVMSRDDPSYMPSCTNPFASITRFQHGRKLLGTSIDFAMELPSPATLFTPPSTPGCSDPRCLRGDAEERRCQSLPSSPVLLRRAAEKLHQESLHGSAQYVSQHVARSRSKSTVCDAIAVRLQVELALNPHRRHMSPGIPEAQHESEHSVSNCNNSVTLKGVSQKAVSGNGSSTYGSSKNGSSTNGVSTNGVGDKIQHSVSVPRRVGLRSSPQWQGPTQTATAQRRSMRRLKYQSLDGDAMGIPHVHPLYNGTQACKANGTAKTGMITNNCNGSSHDAGVKNSEDTQREASPASIQSSCDSFMSLDEHCTSMTSSLSSYSEAND